MTGPDSPFAAPDSASFYALDTAAMAWTEFDGEPAFKPLQSNPDSGAAISIVRYPAGMVTPWHTHPCSHGLYVLEGRLVTDQGSHGPGSFVWFPEGREMRHGATAEEDVTVLFITDKAFEMHYIDPR